MRQVRADRGQQHRDRVMSLRRSQRSTRGCRRRTFHVDELQVSRARRARRRRSKGTSDSPPNSRDMVRGGVEQVVDVDAWMFGSNGELERNLICDGSRRECRHLGRVVAGVARGRIHREPQQCVGVQSFAAQSLLVLGLPAHGDGVDRVAYVGEVADGRVGGQVRVICEQRGGDAFADGTQLRWVGENSRRAR